MALKGQVSIDSDTLNLVNSKINLISSYIEEAGGKLPGKFQGLSTLGLYSDGTIIIKEQLDFLMSSLESINTELAKHVQDTSDMEDDLVTTFTNNYGRYDASRGTNSGTSFVTSDNSSNAVEEGTPIKSDQLVGFIKNADPSVIKKIVELFELNKGDSSIIELLFNYDKSISLFKKLLSALGYGEKGLSSITEDEYKEVYKEFINKIFEGEVIPSSIAMNSILTAKDYLIKIADKNNISVADMFFKEDYKELLKTSLINLYNGSNLEEDDSNEDERNNFKTFIDKMASDNNKNYTEIIEDMNLLL